jgi:hypothetical protein
MVNMRSFCFIIAFHNFATLGKPAYLPMPKKTMNLMNLMNPETDQGLVGDDDIFLRSDMDRRPEGQLSS